MKSTHWHALTFTFTQFSSSFTLSSVLTTVVVSSFYPKPPQTCQGKGKVQVPPLQERCCGTTTTPPETVESSGNNAEGVGNDAPAFLATVMLVLELAGNAARDNKKTRIIPRHLQLSHLTNLPLKFQLNFDSSPLIYFWRVTLLWWETYLSHLPLKLQLVSHQTTNKIVYDKRRWTLSMFSVYPWLFSLF